MPSYKLTALALMRLFYNAGVEVLNGFQLYKVTDAEYAAADTWLASTGLKRQAEEVAAGLEGAAEPIIDEATTASSARWSSDGRPTRV